MTNLLFLLLWRSRERERLWWRRRGEDLLLRRGDLERRRGERLRRRGDLERRGLQEREKQCLYWISNLNDLRGGITESLHSFWKITLEDFYFDILITCNPIFTRQWSLERSHFSLANLANSHFLHLVVARMGTSQLIWRSDSLIGIVDLSHSDHPNNVESWS